MRMKDFFYLQKSDRISILFLVALIALVSGGVWLTGSRQQATPLSAEDSLAMAMALNNNGRHLRSRHHRNRQDDYRNGQDDYRNGQHLYYKAEERRTERFPFDPNTADSTQLLRLGLSPFSVRNIYRYRAAGGTYRRVADFARTYGLSRKLYEELKPYIHISDYYQDARSYYTTTHTDTSPRDTIAYPVKMVPGETVELNAADTTALKHIPGIGSGYARRIVRYRQQLGGFVSIGQLREINGFPESALGYFRLEKAEVSRININRLSLSQLRAHPYLNFYQAKAITDYRRLHGPLRSIEQLRLLEEFKPDDLARLAPYVAY